MECKIRQELDLSIKYEKAQQDVGLFYCLFKANHIMVSILCRYKDNMACKRR